VDASRIFPPMAIETPDAQRRRPLFSGGLGVSLLIRVWKSAVTLIGRIGEVNITIDITAMAVVAEDRSSPLSRFVVP